jgi:hypothetical protein
VSVVSSLWSFFFVNVASESSESGSCGAVLIESVDESDGSSDGKSGFELEDDEDDELESELESSDFTRVFQMKLIFGRKADALSSLSDLS